ncbi:hypothetical protein ABZ678_30935 [Streptomyces hirsutus]|uniref:hypothetical protein n=1 Tax=Streptomyces hirsutus TaxID=35620 RepID=UPI0033E72669
MADSTELRSFLLIGDQRGDSASAKLKALGIPYKVKLLESTPDNWRTVLGVLESGNIRAVIARLSGGAFQRISRSSYTELADSIFAGIGSLPHIAFAHEDTLRGELNTERIAASRGGRPLTEVEERNYQLIYSTPSKEEVAATKEVLARHRINLIPYNTNAELSVLASGFIDDAEKNLLFRVYVPSGRLYAAEAEKLLALFHDWLQRGGRTGIRRDGYKTAAGQVFEFCGGDDLQPGDLPQAFSDFSNFLDLCVDDPTVAENSLRLMGLERHTSHEMVARYSREVRRLQLDLKHERETRMLTIRHNLEAEVLEINGSHQAQSEVVNRLVETLVPHPRNFPPGALLGGTTATSPTPVVINLNPQYVHAVESTVLQNIQGTVNLGPEPKQLLELIQQHGADETGELESAVHELEDPDARPADRLTARQRLKAFLGRVGAAVEGTAITALQKYLESKLTI